MLGLDPKVILRSGGAALMIAGFTLIWAGGATAAPGGNGGNNGPGAPGDNGTVKIHEDGATPDDDPRNEPHVCHPRLTAFNFDDLQEVSWQIHEHPPTGNDLAAEGAITLVDGTGSQLVTPQLPAGHYKLTWTFEGEHGSAKHKVFWVECDAPTQPPTDPATEETPTDPATEETPTDPATEETPTDPATEQTPTDPATEETPTDPATEQTPTDPATEQTPTDPATEQTPTDPATEQTPTDPAT
ncbi:MAG: hypothetical protein L0Y54_15755, partial [Sporichthyaceae bacterium]|nr:hypothetical protein [Sporichthyaceae bacterium]